MGRWAASTLARIVFLVSTKPLRVVALQLASAADVDPRTSARALREGVDALRGARVRERVATAARELGIQLPLAGAS